MRVARTVLLQRLEYWIQGQDYAYFVYCLLTKALPNIRAHQRSAPPSAFARPFWEDLQV